MPCLHVSVRKGLLIVWFFLKSLPLMQLIVLVWLLLSVVLLQVIVTKTFMWIDAIRMFFTYNHSTNHCRFNCLLFSLNV